jgi:hypothetical protein
MRASICILLLLTAAPVASASELTREAEKELKASKDNTKDCKKVILLAAQKDSPNDKKRAEAQFKQTMKKVDGFCGGPKWFEGCVVLNASKDKCAFIELDDAKTREPGRKKLYFPADFR